MYKYSYNAYNVLTNFFSDSSKWCELANKLKGIVTKYDSDEGVSAIITDHKNSDDKNKTAALRSLLIHYLSHTDKFIGQSLKLVSVLVL